MKLFDLVIELLNLTGSRADQGLDGGNNHTNVLLCDFVKNILVFPGTQKKIHFIEHIKA